MIGEINFDLVKYNQNKEKGMCVIAPGDEEKVIKKIALLCRAIGAISGTDEADELRRKLDILVLELRKVAEWLRQDMSMTEEEFSFYLGYLDVPDD